MSKTPESTEANRQPNMDDVLKRMLSSPPAPHPKPKQKAAKTAKNKPAK